MRYLEQQIANRRAKLREISDQITQLKALKATVEGELRAYEDALAHIGTGALAPPSTTSSAPPTKQGGRRGLSHHWKAVIREMVKNSPAPAGYDLIERVLRNQGKDIKRPNLRRHIMAYIEHGYLERVRDGQFRPTDKGRKAAGLPANSKTKGSNQAPLENETPDAGTSGVSTRGSGGGATLLSESRELSDLLD